MDMARFSIAAAVAALVLFIASPVFAQALPAGLRSAGVTQAQWDAVRAQVRVEAQRAQISEAALLAASEAASANLAGSGQFNALTLQQSILEALSEQADQIAELEERLDALTGDADPAAAALFAQARAALDDGRLGDADRLLAQSVERDLAAVQQADADIERRRLRAGETIASRGQVAFVQAEFLVSAQHYARAAETVPQSAITTRWRYHLSQARSLLNQGQRFGEPVRLREAVLLHREVILPLAPRSVRPMDWAKTQNLLGEALGEAGGHDSRAFQEAVVAFGAALEVYSRESTPMEWAGVQHNLGIVLQQMRSFRESEAALRSALEVRTRDSDPLKWAGTQNSLGVTLQRMGEQGDREALLGAAAAYRSILGVYTRDRFPTSWAMAQRNLGNVLIRLAERGDRQLLVEAIAAERRALELYTRDQYPIEWAFTTMSLGYALKTLGFYGDNEALNESILAFREIQEVLTSERSMAGYGAAQLNLALALRIAIERGQREHLSEAVSAAHTALDAYRRAGDTYWAGRAQSLIVELEAMR